LNKKTLAIIVTIVTLAMVLTPMVGMVQAGKGQESLSFKLYYTGAAVTAETWEAGNNVHHRDRPWLLAGDDDDFFIEIGGEDRITGERLSLDVSMDTAIHNAHGEKARFTCNAVIDTITIYDVDEVTVMGTLEIRGHNNPTGKPQSCVGFGSGEFEGVKIKGTSTPTVLQRPPNLLVEIVREGTVMGWPTP